MSDSLIEFVSIVRRLRRECPWDREQTHASLRPMLIEEAYETIEAIDHACDTGDYTDLKKELGDLLLHILFHSDLAREEGYFTLRDVIEAECEKLIYRHPHVFSDVKVEGAEQVSRNWEQLKRLEKGRNSILHGVPSSMPSLQRAQRIQERAAKVGFDWPDSQGVWKKIREEILELEAEGIGDGVSGIGYRVSGIGYRVSGRRKRKRSIIPLFRWKPSPWAKQRITSIPKLPSQDPTPDPKNLGICSSRW